MSTETTLKAYGNFHYALTENNEITITRYSGTDPRPLIPAQIEGRPVTVIGKNSFFGSPVESVTVPEGIQKIETNAFATCDDLQEVILPCSLATLGRGIFQGSENLREVSLSGESENYIVYEGVLYDRNECCIVFCPPALGLEQITVPYGTVAIADSALYANRSLKYVHLPLTLRTIESGAFLFTNRLRMIELPPYLKEIADDAFLVGSGPFAEKRFEIYAFPGTPGYRYAQERKIPVHPLYAIVTD